MRQKRRLLHNPEMNAAAVEAAESARRLASACVHCGFCLPACPTYAETQDERDSPRGRIYLIQEMLDGGGRDPNITATARRHLDRCLTCRSCETACPSGVRYGAIAEAGRRFADETSPRSFAQNAVRGALAAGFGGAARTKLPAAAAALAKPILPRRLAQQSPTLPSIFQRKKIPTAPESQPSGNEKETVILLPGCVQDSFASQINDALARILAALNIRAVMPPARCCGALRMHLGRRRAARADMRQIIDAWHPLLASGRAGCAVVSASGCAAFFADYAEVFADDSEYADKAAFIAEKTKSDVAFLEDKWEAVVDIIHARRGKESDPQNPNSRSDSNNAAQRLAFHSPCTVQHHLREGGRAERLLEAAGWELCAVAEPHLCCGSSGTYSLLNPKMAAALGARKMRALLADKPAQIATANIGCLLHLRAASPAGAPPPQHWLNAVADRMGV